ncbi:PTS sugar transporter subunit IIA [Clostridium sp. CCUG 7971]|uniref:PTS sugar transporter subunit IIA n=1 Tax=Clostridium sp. CCUG 7971 TaxID=2811414 RepID=UPI001ABAC4B6|nr:PTS sugar transporter subunit IIA [Clostridium sp. CCUG 7971]MBO3446009.1 PTS sugar transporter subunit IIA [Clostridium sp. CCUG 7971]
MIIITGHGQFGTGLKTSLDLIVGDHNFIKPVDFTEGKSPEKLKEEIKSIVKEDDGNVYIFTDLVGGTPFKVSSELTLEHNNLEVLCGTNLPMLVEATMMVSLGCDINSESIKDAGISSIRPQAKTVVFADDGI